MRAVNLPIKKEFHQINTSAGVLMTQKLLQKHELVFNNLMVQLLLLQINISVVKRKNHHIHLVPWDTVI